MSAYPCPCCGHLVFEAPPGSDDICMLCFWEDDATQLRFPDLGNQTNFVPLAEAQQNYAKFGAIEQRFAEDVRKPTAEDARDPEFRPISPSDSFEEGPSEAEGPSDGVALYYWRPTFWRRAAAHNPAE
jgi:hypothetical protein